MELHGREVHFLLTVGATKAIAKLCPDGDIQNIGLIFADKATDKMIDVIAELAAAMSEGYENQQKYIKKDYEPNPVSKEEVMTLTIPELEILQEDLMNEIGAGMKTEVIAEPEKVKGKKNGKVTA